MAKVIMVSRQFPNYHPKAGEPTWFVEKIWKSLLLAKVINIPETIVYEAKYEEYFPCQFNDPNESVSYHKPKNHTIRNGKRWKDGDMASIRVWSGKPYGSKQIAIAPDVKLKVLDVEIDAQGMIKIAGKVINAIKVAENDGLSATDMCDWFEPSLPFIGQILIWSPEKVDYQ